MRAICKKALRGKRPKVIPSRAMRSVDHTGREFPSLQAMCDFWGVTPSRYRAIRKRGHTLEEALTPPEYHRGKICRDHTGREFPTLQSMCDFWHINISTYHNRVRDGLPLRAVLTSPVRGKAKNDA